MPTARNPSTGAVANLNVGNERFSFRLPTLPEVAQFLRRASRWRMRAPTLLSTRNDWANTRLAILFDIIWNLFFVVAAAVILITSSHESPETPLRLWVIGYAAQCLFHLACMYVWRRKRGMAVRAQMGVGEGNAERWSRGNSEARSSRPMRDIQEVVRNRGNDRREENQSAQENMQSANAAFIVIWWIIGLHWVSTGAETLNHDAPQLFWLSIVFLALDFFFLAFVASLACTIGLMVCCCFPCMAVVLYMVPEKKGASDEVISQLPKYIFRKVDGSERFASEISGPCGGIMTECGNDPPQEHVIQPEDADCCICVSPYDDGAELRGLPCNHHFHLDCIEKWLRLNPTCPLCKFNISESSNHGMEEV